MDFPVGTVILGDGEDDRAAVIEIHGLANGGVAVGALADNFGALGFEQRRGRDFRPARRGAIGQHHQRLLGDFLGCHGLEVLAGRLLAHAIRR